MQVSSLKERQRLLTIRCVPLEVPLQVKLMSTKLDGKHPDHDGVGPKQKDTSDDFPAILYPATVALEAKEEGENEASSHYYNKSGELEMEIQAIEMTAPYTHGTWDDVWTVSVCSILLLSISLSLLSS